MKRVCVIMLAWLLLLVGGTGLNAAGWMMYIYNDTLGAGSELFLAPDDMFGQGEFEATSWSFYLSTACSVSFRGYVDGAWVWSDTIQAEGGFTHGEWHVVIDSLRFRALGAVDIVVNAEAYSSI